MIIKQDVDNGTANMSASNNINLKNYGEISSKFCDIVTII